MRFIGHFFAGLVSLMALVGAINYLIDPFDLWGAPLIAGVNTAKSFGNIVFLKPLQVEVRHPRTVVLGTSRVQFGIDPRDFPPDERAYNFGIPAAKLDELKAYAEHILAHTQTNKLVIGLDFFAFNDTDRGESSYRKVILGDAALLRAAPVVLFSQAALERSRHTLADSRKKRVGNDRGDGFSLFSMGSGRDAKTEFLAMVARFVANDYIYGDYRSFARSMRDYRALLTAARARGVTVVSYISPVHAAFLEAIDCMGLWPTFKAWERELAQVSQEFNVPLWDFAGYNEITTTPLKDGFRTHFDGSHFRPEIGRLVIARIYGEGEPSTFGIRVDPGNIEAHLAEMEAARERYRVSNAADVADVAATVAAKRWRPRE
jgi:hypothetical protein